MRNFDELAKDYQFSPVRGHDSDLAGYLHLDAAATKADLNSRGFHHFSRDENGWFDLELEDHRGRKVLLHNALTQKSSMPGYSAGKAAGSYTSTIFPNIVVLEAENLRKDRTLLQMAFEFEGAENFFVYDLIEWHSLYRQPQRRSILNAIRKAAWKPPDGLGERFRTDDPHEIYVLHNPKRYLDFKIDDMRVQVWHSRSQRGLGWTGHRITVTPIVSVVFDSPISIDEAINRAWRIKGFFDQIALCDLRVKAISFSKFKKGWPSASAYLPNEASRSEKRSLDIHPLYVPFSRWTERKEFQSTLKAWLDLSKKRRFFRQAVRLSLVRLQSELDHTLITLLMAAVESLEELRGKSAISKQSIDKMAQAAHTAVPTVDLASIKSSLGNLGRISPKQRLKKIADRSFVVPADIETFISSAVEFRNSIAHGRGLNEIERSVAGELVRTLTYVCIVYDLETSGMPSPSVDIDGRNLLARTQMSWAWQGYKMVSSSA